MSKQNFRDIWAASNETWLARLAPVGDGPGDEFFSDLRDASLQPELRQAVRDIRELLASLGPAFVRPEDTHGSLNDLHMIELVISHAAEPETEIRLVYGDGYLSLTWPDGEAHDKWEWWP